MTLTTVVLSVVASVLATELTDFFPAIARRILRWHVGRLPEGLRQRALEEWSADLDAIPGHLFKLLFALDLFRAVNGMVWEVARRAEELGTQTPEMTGYTLERLARAEMEATVAALDDFVRVASNIAHYSPNHREWLFLQMKEFLYRSPREFKQVLRTLDAAAQARYLQLVAQEASGEKRE